MPKIRCCLLLEVENDGFWLLVLDIGEFGTVASDELLLLLLLLTEAVALPIADDNELTVELGTLHASLLLVMVVLLLLLFDEEVLLLLRVDKTRRVWSELVFALLLFAAIFFILEKRW